MTAPTDHPTACALRIDTRATDAVVVTYRPDLARLAMLLTAVAPQVRSIHLVDNGNGTSLIGLSVPEAPFVLHTLGDNVGIAAAQNAGMRAAFERGASTVLLLDQDSVPAADMVARLIEGQAACVAQGLAVAAVGPRAPSHEAPAAFVRVGWRGYREVPFTDAQPFVQCDILIASGCLISREAWLAVGPMDEALFIDKVDTEWCLRAAALGWAVAGVPTAVLHHTLGDRRLRVWWRRWKHLPVHQPFRYYYMARNGLLVSRKPWVSWRWRAADAKQSLLIALLFGVFAPSRVAVLKHIARGLLHGALGRSGPLEAR